MYDEGRLTAALNSSAIFSRQAERSTKSLVVLSRVWASAAALNLGLLAALVGIILLLIVFALLRYRLAKNPVGGSGKETRSELLWQDRVLRKCTGLRGLEQVIG